MTRERSDHTGPVDNCTDTGRVLTAGLKVVVILGPTATGKTRLSLDLAARFDSEIINADSRYLYRGMDVGTAKPTPDELGSVPHHLVDILDPDESYSLARFLDDAYAAIESVAARGRMPIVVGGTPLYLRALLEGWTVPRAAPDPELRSRLDELNTDELFEEVQAVDPASAERIGPGNRRRLIRALEVYRKTGQPMSELEGRQPPPYRFLRIGLYQERETLYRRIDDRARRMFANGLLDEARRLREVDPAAPSMSAIGYPEARAVVEGELDLETAIERTCHANHRFVRHQETWFRRFPDVHWFDSSRPDLLEQVTEVTSEFLSG